VLKKGKGKGTKKAVVEVANPAALEEEEEDVAEAELEEMFSKEDPVFAMSQASEAKFETQSRSAVRAIFCRCDTHICI